jgi:hypothetical protein
MILTLFISVCVLLFAMVAGAALVAACQQLDDTPACAAVALCSLTISSVGIYVLSSR